MDNNLSTACATIQVFVFLGAMLVHIYEEIALRTGSDALSIQVMSFQNVYTLTSILIALCVVTVFILVLVTIGLVRHQYLERKAAEKWAGQTLNPPTFEWRPTMRYATFLRFAHPPRRRRRLVLVRAVRGCSCGI